MGARMIQTKICGLSTRQSVEAALAGDAAYVGFVSFPPSPRHIALEAARPLADQARGRARIVSLMVDPSEGEVAAVVAALDPDLIQLHGAETPDRVRRLKAAAGGRGVIKALPVSEASDLAAARQYDGLADYLMFDAKPPKGADRPGGHGQAFDWTLLRVASFASPWFLAGGLAPDNVGEAVRQSGAALVDVSSGVERDRGYKDPALISAFLDAVRSA